MCPTILKVRWIRHLRDGNRPREMATVGCDT